MEDDPRLEEHFIRVGIAATHLAHASVEGYPHEMSDFTMKWGKLSFGDHSTGTLGVEPTADDWERLVLMLTENGVHNADKGG